MYCIKCGARLDDGEHSCPLCSTPVYNPLIEIPQKERLYPEYEKKQETVSKFGAMFIVTTVFLLVASLTLICDISISGSVTWSGYAVSSLLLIYIIGALPAWFEFPNPVIFVPCDFAAVAAFLWYIEYATGGKWFFTFALPATAMLLVIVEPVITLRKYVRRGALFVYGGAFIGLGAYLVGVELFMNYTFGIKKFLAWSQYPLTAAVLIGLMLIVIAICKPMRESLKKKFFI
jgi:hypothetical protein